MPEYDCEKRRKAGLLVSVQIVTVTSSSTVVVVLEAAALLGGITMLVSVFDGGAAAGMLEVAGTVDSARELGEMVGGVYVSVTVSVAGAPQPESVEIPLAEAVEE